jgi:amino acid transporter
MWDYIVHRLFGIGGEGGAQVRLGAGVVNLTTTAFIAFCVAAAGISWALSRDPYLALAVVGVMAFVGLVYFVGTWIFADKHPDQAALGGSWWLKFRELQIEAKGQPDLQVLPPSTDPLQPLPPSSTSLLSPRTLTDGQAVFTYHVPIFGWRSKDQEA